MAKDFAIVLNNGSVNAAVATALAAQRFRPIMLFLETSTQPSSRARAAFDQQVAQFKPYREHAVPMGYLSTLRNENLAGAIAADPRHGSLAGRQLLELLPVIAIGARYAVHYQAAAIYAGVRVGPLGDDLAQATEFTQIWNELLQLPCGQADLDVVTPLLELEPWQVVDVGFQVNAPLERTWSCLEEMPEPCWACRGCRARESAFQQSGKPDPIRVVRKV